MKIGPFSWLVFNSSRQLSPKSSRILNLDGLGTSMPLFLKASNQRAFIPETKVMKNVNPKIFPSHAIEFLSALISRAVKSIGQDAVLSTGNIRNTQKSSQSERIMELCGSPFFGLLSQEEINGWMQQVYCRFGLAGSLRVNATVAGNTGLMVECRSGNQQLLLKLDRNRNISFLDIRDVPLHGEQTLAA